MGLFHPLNDRLRGLFAEERAIFNHNNREVVQTVASESLKVIALRMKESLITNELNDLFHQDDTWIPLIHTLFKNQGNISLTAKELLCTEIPFNIVWINFMSKQTYRSARWTGCS